MLRGQKMTTTSSEKEVPHPSVQSRKFATRSCRGCHQRKIRCDRAVPCTNCSRCGIICVYPTKESDMARKAPTLQSIANRLERLEDLLSRLVEDGQITTVAAGGRRRESQTQVPFHSGANVNRTEAANQHPSNQDPGASTWELLLNEEEVVQYANKSLPGNEERVRNPPSTASGTTFSHIQKSTKAHHTPHAQSNASSLSSNFFDALDFYPDTQLALRLWNVYVKSVDPVLKILHIPTVQSIFVETILDPKSAQSSIVALTYAIYFAAVTALCHDDSEPMALPSEKHELLKRYKKSLDQLLMATELMNRPELVSLQALAIYATCLRVHEVGRSVWVLNGLAIRLAQSIGLHRDGASLQLSPFDTEIRLRLWWHLCVLDSRAPEDQGFQPTVDVINRGLRLPLNVNDNQIYPGMTRLPVESHGWTEMSFFLIQTESCRLLHPILNIQYQYSTNAFLGIREKRNLIDEHGRSLMAKYGMLPGDAAAASTDLLHIAIQHTATAHKKMQFVLQLREEVSMQKQKGAQGDSISDVEKRSFKLACEALECSRVLLREGIASRSGLQWFFKMYTQWYALAYVLRCLCGSPQGPETERAWTLVEELFPLGMSLDDEYWHGSIWSYLNLLRSQASSLRQYDQRPSTGGNEHSISSHTLPPDVKIPPSTDTPETTPTGAAHGTSGFSELDQELITDSNQTFFSSLDLSMPEFPFLPDWNAIINGCLINDIPEIDTYSCGDYPADIA
ncbi:hypothetical protein EYB26_006155 [Talaromyces marneffei]|uniref:Zn(2)-C6 fungal-type domain-containing protein n=1 Tax=Talaromyces marneffei (strain ATCC 18224 / CBS 334.59 / QM 7333) TaxID=441960 RepID=B6QBK6_TALMQ|nr:uncharacterized protein EYB26_006155 [Talaromyces marneffei]EEA26447.1 conserved hypothetical protein [Talaromyces marneffei ATCC 18224]QGA18470.1 hypothetical protein EYB26_006155 [Talaromyces marneffei]